MTFPYKEGKAVAAMIPGPALVNGTVSQIKMRADKGREVLVVFPGTERYEQWYFVSPSGGCDYLLDRPLRPTVNDDRVTPNERYAIERKDNGVVVTFDGEVIGNGKTEAEGWDIALRHDYYAREGGGREGQ
ncbi:hypothetical protein [Amycolatopsis sp. GM8]|uniref:hypothetical protein n=1 Tax=Amycolatopsis sp. GM8 TaxID=2896530 RepID=UPI001F3D62AF|nr:hypothetical protein [Amycolatopsis sp. GM8]